jgi:hypothetical protein
MRREFTAERTIGKMNTNQVVLGKSGNTPVVQKTMENEGVYKGFGSLQVHAEVAAYNISRIFGKRYHQFAPPTVKTADNQIRQRFIKDIGNSFNEHFKNNYKHGDILHTSFKDMRNSGVIDGRMLNDMARMTAFDMVINNRDRHSHNFGVKQGRIVAYDNGLSFQAGDDFNYSATTTDKFRTSLMSVGRKFSNKKLPKSILAELSTLRQRLPKYSEKLIASINRVQYDAMLSRIDTMIRTKRFLPVIGVSIGSD